MKAECIHEGSIFKSCGTYIVDFFTFHFLQNNNLILVLKDVCLSIEDIESPLVLNIIIELCVSMVFLHSCENWGGNFIRSWDRCGYW